MRIEGWWLWVGGVRGRDRESKLVVNRGRVKEGVCARERDKDQKG